MDTYNLIQNGAKQIKAYVFSIGEPTTKLCIEALNNQGVEVVLYQDGSRFTEKYKRMLDEATDDVFLRVDADIIVNHRVKEYLSQAKDWSCAYGWVWWQQDLQPISVMHYTREVIDIIKAHVHDKVFLHTARPEQYMWSLPELKDKIHKVYVPVGIKGYGVRNLKPVKERKANRGQTYNWRWVEKINEL